MTACALRHPFEQQRHRGDEMSLALLQRQASDVADQEVVRAEAQVAADLVAFALERLA